MEKKLEVKNVLKNEKVTVTPIFRRGNWLPKGHDGEFMFTGAKQRFCVPRLPNGALADPLTEDERKFFESAEGGLSLKPGDLSVYKKDDNYWERMEIVLDKNGVTLDLSNPMDYIRYAILRANKHLIAPTLSEALKKASYKFALVKDEEKHVSKVKSADKNKEAWMEFGKISDSPERMMNFLKVYGKNVAKNSKRDFLVGQISDIIEIDIDGFLKVITDENYSIKCFIHTCIDKGVVIREGKTNYYIPSLEAKFNNLFELINYLNNIENQESYLRLQALCEA
jgi:hypothetical protein